MEKKYTMIVKSIRHTEVENDQGSSDASTLSMKNEEKGIFCTITAEAGAWDGLMIGERIQINIFNPQMTLNDSIEQKDAQPKDKPKILKKEDDIMHLAKTRIKNKKKEKVTQ